MEFKTVSTDNKDLKDLTDKLDVFFDEEWGETARSYQNFHQLSKMAYALICYENGLPAGCGCFKIMDEQTIEIKRMYVEPACRSRGLASEMLRLLEKAALQQGYCISVLETGKDMKGAVLFYEKQGYEIVENYGDFIGDEICVCMRKKIRG